MADNINVSIEEQAIDLRIDAGVILSVSNYPGVSGILALQGSGTYTQGIGTIQFANSNNITFGLQSNRMTASFSQSTHDHDYIPLGNSTQYATSVLSNTFLTTAMLSNAGSLFAGTGTSGTNVTMTLNSNGLALSVDTSGGGFALKGSGTYTQNTGTIEFANSNSMTFGLTDNQMTGSFSYTQSTHEHPYLGSGESTYYQTSNLSSVFLTTAALSDHTHDQYVNTSISSQWLTTAAESNHTHGDISLSLSRLTGSYSSASNGLTLSLSGMDGNVAFVDSNGITFGNSIDGISTTVTASYNSTLFLDTGAAASFVYTSASSLLQHTTATSVITADAVNTSISSQWLTTAMASENTSLFQYTSATSDITSNAVNTSVTSQWLTTGALSNHSHGDVSTVSTAGSDLVFTSASNGLTLGIPAWLTTAAGGGGGTSVVPGDYLSSTLDGSTLSLSVTGLQATSATSAITASAVNTSVTSNYQLIANSTLSLGTEYSSHTHSDLYIALANSTDYATSVLSGTFQTTGAYLTTAMASDQGSNYVGLATTGITNASATINSSQLLIDLPAYLTTAAVSNHSHGNPTLNLTNLTGTTASASNGMTLSLSGPAHGNVYYVDSNGFSFSSSTNGVSTSIWIVT